jgi:hypothetical protein
MRHITYFLNILRKHTAYTAISIKVVHEQSGKVEYERERLLGVANKLMNFQSGFPAAFRARIRLFRFARSIQSGGSGAGGALSTTHDVITV